MRVHEFGLTQGMGRWLRDFVLALSLFWLAVFACDGPQNHAHAIPLPSHVAGGVERPVALNVHAGATPHRPSFASCASPTRTARVR